MDARRTIFSLAMAALLSGGAAVARASEPEDALAHLRVDWMQLRTPSVRVYCDPTMRPGREALQRLEATVQRLCDRFGVDPRTRASLFHRPIEYVLTEDTALIDQLTGIDAEGAAFAEKRLILATSLPHEHEIVHVVLHLALQTPRAGNSSFLEEGLASAIGGHGGEAPTAVMVSADEVMARGPVPWRRFFTEAGFDRAPFDPHERYALAARFVDHLLRERGGWAKLEELLTILAGDPEEIRRRPARATIVQLEGVYACSFDELIAEFLGWVAANPATRGMREVRPARAPDVTARDARHELSLWEEDGAWILELGARAGTIAVQVSWGAEQPRAPWAAAAGPTRRFGLEIDRTRAELRDQRDGRLLMRWAAGADPLRNLARIRIDADALGLERPRTWTVWSRPDVPSYD